MWNRALRTLWIYNGLFVLAGSLFGPLYAVYVQNISDGVIAITLSWTAFLVSSTIFTYIVSRLGDRVKEKEYLLMAGFLIRAVAWVLYIFVGSLEMLIAIQVLLGLGEALGSPAYNALMATHIDKGRGVKEYSETMIIFNLISALATLAGGFIVVEFGFTPLFLTMSALALVSFFGILLKPRNLI